MSEMELESHVREKCIKFLEFAVRYKMDGHHNPDKEEREKARTIKPEQLYDLFNPPKIIKQCQT